MRYFEVSCTGFPGTTWDIIAETAGKAKYRKLLDIQDAYEEARITDMRARVIDRMPRERLGFRACVERRGIPFATIGMRVTCDGREGVIVGHNDSSNLDVLMDGVVGNCHPHWRLRYFLGDGTVETRGMDQ